MLKNIKKHVFKAMYNYHYHMSNYCYGKVDMYGPEDNAYWNDKVAKHINKEFELVNKLVKNGGGLLLRASFLYAGMVELVDSSDLGSDVERRAGSSPATGTK